VCERVAATKDYFSNVRSASDELDDVGDLGVGEPPDQVKAYADTILTFAVATVGRTGVREKNEHAARELVHYSLDRSVGLLIENVSI